MSNEQSSSLNLVRHHYQRGNFQEAAGLALEICEQTKANDRTLWLQAARICFQSYHELMQLEKIRFLYDDLLSLARAEEKVQIQGRVSHLLGLWQLALGERNTAGDLLEGALAKATSAQDFEYIARCLHALAFLATLENKPSIAHSLLDKTLILAAEIEFEEILVSCRILRAHLFFSENKLESCLDLTWQAYELAKKAGYHHLEANIMVHLARIYQRQGKSVISDIYRTLVTRGLDKNKFPRLYQAIKIYFPDAENDFVECDLVIDQDVLTMRERHKGCIDFKHQYLLFDLAKMFSENRGRRFSKEDLVQKIWNRSYAPDVDDNLIYVNIKRLRMLIEPNPESPQYILRDRSGYYMPSATTIKFKNRGSQ